MAHFFHINEETKDFIKWQIKEEAKKSQVKTTEEVFFDWNTTEIFRNKGRSHSMISELFMAATQVRIGINYAKKTMWWQYGQKKIKRK
jgi:hypothetical protein